MSTKQLNCCQACWAEYLLRFNFKIQYHSECLSMKSDAFTWRLKDLSSVKDFRIEHHNQIVFKFHQIAVNDIESVVKLTEFDSAALTLLFKTSAEEDDKKTSLNQVIAEAYTDDSFVNKILKLLCNEVTQFKKITLAECKAKEKHL